MKETNEPTTGGLLKTLLGYFKPHKKLFFLDISCALLAALIDLVYPLISRMAMYDLLPEKKFRAFFVVMGIIVVSYILRAALYYVFTYWGHRFGTMVEADIRTDLFCHLQTLSFDFYDRNRIGQLMSRLTSDLFEVVELAHHGPEDLLIACTTFVGALIVMFTIEWRLALLIAVLIPLFLYIVISQRNAFMRTGKEVKVEMAGISTDIESSLSGMRTSKAFTNEKTEQAKFERANERYRNAKKGYYREMAKFLSRMEFFMSILSVAVIAFGGYLIMTDRMDYIGLITFSLYITTFINPIRKLSSFSELFTSGFAGLRRFAELMAISPTVQDKKDAKTLAQVKGEITIDHVGFAYRDDLDVLRDMSLTVREGETIAIVGPSGGGKTTLCQLIPRFYDVTEGAIRIDGLDVRDVTQESLRRNIGIVQQDVFLFADTVLENIRYGREDATQEEVEEAARRAEIYDDIAQMPEGFQTYVGERGARLSGGQKQRIAIARIFLKNPKILILDEATSALDSLTEAKIQRAFDQLAIGRTTLIIAHRLSTVRNADRILVVGGGEILESGSHEVLLQKGGLYHDLYTTQTMLR